MRTAQKILFTGPSGDLRLTATLQSRCARKRQRAQVTLLLRVAVMAGLCSQEEARLLRAEIDQAAQDGRVGRTPRRLRKEGHDFEVQ